MWIGVITKTRYNKQMYHKGLFAETQEALIKDATNLLMDYQRVHASSTFNLFIAEATHTFTTPINFTIVPYKP